jgi:hypothetical protein
MLSYQVNPCARYRWAVGFKLILAAVCLSASGIAYGQLSPSQQQAVSNLQQSSGSLSGTITLGASYSTALGTAANQGIIVDPTAHQAALLTEQQRTAYNSALGTFQAANFYTASQFFADQAALSRTQMQGAISSLADAMVDLQKVIAVNQTVRDIADPAAARAAQQVIANAGLGGEVTASQMSAYNQSLANVNSYASQTAAFMRAANSQSITGNVDNFAAQYGRTLDYATASFSYASAGIAVSWGELVIVQNGVLSAYQQSAESFQSSLQVK